MIFGIVLCITTIDRRKSVLFTNCAVDNNPAEILQIVKCA